MISSSKFNPEPGSCFPYLLATDVFSAWDTSIRNKLGSHFQIFVNIFLKVLWHI